MRFLKKIPAARNLQHNEPGAGQVRSHSQALLTDLYELTMAAAYFENGVRAPATFELFIRNLPAHRGYLLTAGLEQALDYLEGLSFSAAQIAFLRRHPTFAHVNDIFFEFLARFRFTGEIWAMLEGTPVFPMEPVLRVTAPIIEAQIVETFLLSTITFQTLIATKAARIVQSAGGRQVVEFGSRRAHGPEAGVLAARAAYIGGCVGSSNVEAHLRFGVPSFGTLAHSFVMAYESEEQSLRDFNRVFPEQAVLLLDTYDTLGALDNVIAAGLRPRGVRLDSGDLVALSKGVRKRLDRAGLAVTKIFASGDLDEASISGLLADGAPIDMFGVGTALATSQDAPALSGVYKLAEFSGRPCVKLSHQKPSYPGRKQVFRAVQGELWIGDIVGLADEALAGEPLLACVMRDGKRLASSPSLSQIREYAAKALHRLPVQVRALRDPAPYPVQMSRKLIEMWESARDHRAEPATVRNQGSTPMPTSILFWDVDTQADFIYPDGKLYVPGAEAIVPNLKQLTDWAGKHGVLVISSACAHRPDDAEFAQYPAHCLAGTPGQRKIPETRLPNALTLPNRRVDVPGDLSRYQQIILEKQQLDVFSHPNTEALLEKLGTNHEVILYGVVTEICVAYAARGLMRRGYRLCVVTDAIRHLDESKSQMFLEEIRRSGGILIVTRDLVASLLRRPAA